MKCFAGVYCSMDKALSKKFRAMNNFHSVNESFGTSFREWNHCLYKKRLLKEMVNAKYYEISVHFTRFAEQACFESIQTYCPIDGVAI